MNAPGDRSKICAAHQGPMSAAFCAPRELASACVSNVMRAHFIRRNAPKPADDLPLTSFVPNHILIPSDSINLKYCIKPHVAPLLHMPSISRECIYISRAPERVACLCWNSPSSSLQEVAPEGALYRSIRSVERNKQQELVTVTVMMTMTMMMQFFFFFFKLIQSVKCKWLAAAPVMSLAGDYD